jgi:hypothetical protein
LAVGQWGGGTFVCDAETGRIAQEWPGERNALVAFTPDSRWLVTGTGQEYRFWETGSWKAGWCFARELATGANGAMAFSGNSRLMALARTGRLVQLLDLRTGNVLADLISPAPHAVVDLALSPDGRLLACTGKYGIHLWDLHALREELAALHLDWDQSLPPPSSFSLAKTPFHMKAESVGPAIPPRPTNARPQLLDLSAHYHVPLTETWGNPCNNLGELPSGLHTFGGVEYDVRGSIHLGCRELPQFPTNVCDIPVQQRCRVLHFLGGTGFGPVDGESVATYRIHYLDGQTLDVPVIGGHETANWWFRPAAGANNFDVAWIGDNPEAKLSGYKIRLIHSAWTNPRPDVSIVSLDFISTSARTAPFIVAITTE